MSNVFGFVPSEGGLTKKQLADLVTLDTAQTIEGEKTFTQEIVVENGTDTLTMGNSTLTHINNNLSNAFAISSNYGMMLDTLGNIAIGSITGGSGTMIVIDDSVHVPFIKLTSTGTTTMGDTEGVGHGTAIVIDDPSGQIDINANVISLNSELSGDITISTAGNIRIGNIAGAGNHNELSINTTKMTAKTTNGFQLLDSNIQYPSAFSSAGVALSATSSYAQTFNGSALTATLPTVSATNVGTQFLITNTNAASMSVISSSSQIIYSTIAGGATSRTLATGNSQIFTAIRTTTVNTYGWSMA